MNNIETKCIICWQILGSKKQLLQGMKCLKFEIRETLQSLLHPLDFKALYDESIFPEARICNLCFIAIKQIPKGISKLQDLLNVPINLNLYTPYRKECDVSIDGLKTVNRNLNNSSLTSAFLDHSLDNTKAIQKVTARHKKQSKKSIQQSNGDNKYKSPDSLKCRPKLHHRNKNLECPSTLHTTAKEMKANEEPAHKPENENTKYVSSKHSPGEILVDGHGGQTCLAHHIKLRKLDHGSERISRLLTDVNLALAAPPAAHGQREDPTPSSEELTENNNSIESTLNFNVNIPFSSQHNIDRQRRITRPRVNTHPLPVTRSCMSLRSTQKQIKHTNMECDKPVRSAQTVHYNDPIKFRQRDFSNIDVNKDKIISSDSAVGCLSVMPQRSVECTVARNDYSDSDLKMTTLSCKRNYKKSNQDELTQVIADTVLRTDIPAKLGKHSQKKLQDLTERVKKYLSSKKPHSLMVKCPEKSCDHSYPLRQHLAVHIRYYHHENVRNSLHLPEKTVSCEVSDCDKKFTRSVYMKRHVISYHTGRRQQPVLCPFFTCQVNGCGKKFSLKSTLTRHNLLVHKTGDYKLNRTVVRYPCTVRGCDMAFNRKNLLQKHMVTAHSQIPKHLLSRQSREQNYKENMCAHCGIVLSDVQLLLHANTYYCSNSNKDLKESSPYLCFLEGCSMKFITQAERQAHIKNHIDKPPYKCEVEECKETFFLVKNLDNHLWNHSKKVSTCDVDGCSQAFGDQFQLAKHSKIHYDGKMKCPWRNCGNWFTAMGTLKQHFLAHSRSLKANFGWDFVCNECDRVFTSKYGLRNHKKTHEKINPGRAQTTEFICEEPGCRTEFSRHKHFFDHFLHHYSTTPTACKFEGCTEHFSTLLLQSKHGKSHYDGKYMCPWQDCDKMFASSFFQVKKHVYKHILSTPTVAADRPHACSQCDMVFRIQSNFTNHMAQHSEKSDYVCTVCGKKFHHNHLKRHMLTHKQEKPHACSHCGVRYGTVNGLKFHVLQKHRIGNWPFSCSYCNKGFISSTEMRRHLPSHTKEKPFSCDLCGDTFATHTGYKGHMRKHTGQRYVCEAEGCGKVYTTPLSMRGHKAQHEGFTNMCQFCGKTFQNPYGHKCKASRDAKQKGPKEGPIISGPNEMPLTSAVPASTAASLQHTMSIPQAASNHVTTAQHTDRIVMAPSTIQHSSLIPSSVANNITQGFSHVMPQALGHVLPNHSIMQNTSQPFSLDTTKGTTMNLPRDYTLSNYVVLWGSQNLS